MGISVNELRIGNLVNAKNRFSDIIQIEIHGLSARNNIYDEDDAAWGCEELRPIPLTEDWLLKFGFKKDCIENDNWCFSMFYYDCWRIVYTEKKGYGSADCYLEGFWSVHQLQNLYFALTQKELKLKEIVK